MTVCKRYWLVVALVVSANASGSVRGEEPAPATTGASVPGESEPASSPEDVEKHRAQIEEMTKRLAEDPKDVEALIERGRKCFEIGDIEQGEADFKLARELAPDSPRVWHSYGECLLLRRKFQEAQEALHKALQLGSSDPALYFKAGVTHREMGQPGRAVAYFTAVIQALPNDADAYIRRAQVWNDIGEYRCQIGDWTKAIELGRTDFDSYYARGVAHHYCGELEPAIDDYTAAIEINPKSAELFFARGQAQRGLKHFDNAIADYVQGVALDPKSQVNRATLGIARIENKEYEQGIQDIQEAIRMNPGDLGVDYEPTTNKELSAKALKHGEEQVRRMLSDRPVMAKYVKEGDPIWTWTARRFAGEEFGRMIDWNSNPSHGSMAECFPSNDQDRGEIQVNEKWPDGTSCSFIQLWSSAIFELHNISSVDWFAINERAQKNEFTRDEYILVILKAEELAIQRTRAFYLKYFLPWLQSQDIAEPLPGNWFCDQFIPEFRDVEEQRSYWRNDHRWSHYGMDYDFIVAHRECEGGNWIEAIALLTTILKNEGSLSEEQKHEAHKLLGYAYFNLSEFEQSKDEFSVALSLLPGEKDPLAMRGLASSYLEQGDAALADFNEVVRLHPKWPDGYSYRASEYLRQRRFDAALKDLNKAIELDPQNVVRLGQRVDFWIARGEFEAAISEISDILKREPENAIVWINRAAAWYSLGELDRAENDYSETIRLDPKNGSAFLGRGTICLTKKEYEQAWNDFTSAIEIEPNDLSSYYMRAKLALESDDPKFKRPKEALKDAEKCCELTNWQSAKELEMLAAAYAASEDFDNAIRIQTIAAYRREASGMEECLGVLEEYRAKAKEEAIGAEEGSNTAAQKRP